MKTAYLINSQQFEIRENPSLQPPADGLVLQVKACGVCGSDLRRWKEGLPVGANPITPGHEIAGVISAVGSQVQGYQVGDCLAVAPDVHCNRCYYCQRGLYNLCDDLRLIGITPGYPGGFSEQIILTREILANGIVHLMPAGISFEHAALAEPCSSVLAAHSKLGTTLGDTVVIMGAGPIGCMHIAVAHLRGARVILSEPSPVRRELATLFRPEVVLDPTQVDVVEKVRELTGGRGADAAICANPMAITQTQAVELVRKAGKVVLFGGLPKANPVTNLDGNRIHYGEIEVFGAFSYHPTFHEMALELIRLEKLLANQLITHTFPLEKIDEAFRTAAEGKALKVMVSFSL